MLLSDLSVPIFDILLMLYLLHLSNPIFFSRAFASFNKASLSVTGLSVIVLWFQVQDRSPLGAAGGPIYIAVP